MRSEESAGAEAGKLIVNFKQTTNAIKRGAHRQNKKMLKGKKNGKGNKIKCFPRNDTKGKQ